MKVIPLSNQSLLDIALQYLGDAGRAFEIAELNNIQVSADLSQISELILPDVVAKKKKATVNSYKDKRIIPASKWDFYGLYGDWEIEPIGGELKTQAFCIFYFSNNSVNYVIGRTITISFPVGDPMVTFTFVNTAVLPTDIELNASVAITVQHASDTIRVWLAANRPGLVLENYGVSDYYQTHCYCVAGGEFDGEIGNSIIIESSPYIISSSNPVNLIGGSN